MDSGLVFIHSTSLLSYLFDLLLIFSLLEYVFILRSLLYVFDHVGNQMNNTDCMGGEAVLIRPKESLGLWLILLALE